MTEEEKFRKQFGTRNPFTVPEGYFEKLQQQVMAQIPEEQTKAVKMRPRHSLLRPLASVAASVCVLLGGFAAYTYFNVEQPADEIAMETSIEAVELEGNGVTEDMAEDYIMMDNEAMYSYMAEH